MEKLLTLEEWAATVYGDRPPALVTLRKWAREARIYPAPERHGRSYFVQAGARYSDPAKPVAASRQISSAAARAALVERLHGKKA